MHRIVRHRAALTLVVACLAALVSHPALGATAAREPAGALTVAQRELALSRLDSRLVAATTAAGEEPVTVWVSFQDKGESGPADLAGRLAAAERALTPRARARRLRAHVTPLVDYRDLPVQASYLDALSGRGLAACATSRWLNRAAVRVPGARLLELAAMPFVARVEPVERLWVSQDTPATPDEMAPIAPRLGVQGAASVDYGQNTIPVTQINVPAVHDSGYVGTGVLVCIVDEGFNYYWKHEALRTVPLAPGYVRDFVDGDTTVFDTTSIASFSYNHGTWVMGCVAGNKPGTYVGSGYGAQFALARTEVHNSENPVEMLYWGMGAEWADSLGADVISSSLGYFTFDNLNDNYTYAQMDGHTTTVSRAAEIAANKGILVVTAVGNEGNTGWHYLIAPSDVNGDSVLAIGAVDAAGIVPSFSSYGPNAIGCVKPDLAARGVSNPLVSSGGNPNAYTTASGTSFATPLTSGLVACMIQARPNWPPQYIIRALRETASRANSPDYRMGYGIPNGLLALRWQPPTTDVPPPGVLFGFRLAGPNPLRDDGTPTRVSFAMPLSPPGVAPARVRVLDALGREVSVLWEGLLSCGQRVTVTWDGRDRDDRRLRDGLYFIALESQGRRSALRVALLR